jgi:hypothetical protein
MQSEAGSIPLRPLGSTAANSHINLPPHMTENGGASSLAGSSHAPPPPRFDPSSSRGGLANILHPERLSSPSTASPAQFSQHSQSSDQSFPHSPSGRRSPQVRLEPPDCTLCSCSRLTRSTLSDLQTSADAHHLFMHPTGPGPTGFAEPPIQQDPGFVLDDPASYYSGFETPFITAQD